MTHLEVKQASDGRILARRKDGLPLTPEEKQKARRIALASTPPKCSLGLIPIVNPGSSLEVASG